MGSTVSEGVITRGKVQGILPRKPGEWVVCDGLSTDDLSDGSFYIKVTWVLTSPRQYIPATREETLTLIKASRSALLYVYLPICGNTELLSPNGYTYSLIVLSHFTDHFHSIRQRVPTM